MRRIIKLKALALTALFLGFMGCDSLDTENLNNPDTQKVLASGTDLTSVLAGGYISFWQGVHDDHPVMGLSIGSDMYGVSWGNFAGRRMGEEPRAPYNNDAAEAADYRKLIEDPWSGCLGAVSTANDIINALINGTTVDENGDADKSIRASAYFLRGVSMGYMALMFDQGYRATEETDLGQKLPFVTYQDMLAGAISDLDLAITEANSATDGFSSSYFNGVILDKTMFIELSNSYAARFLASWPRTAAEAAGIDWAAVKTRASAGMNGWDLAPQADGNFWFNYQRYAWEETGQGPFWARIDQRLIKAFDPDQPASYPETIAKGEPALGTPGQPPIMATSADARLLSDFTFFETNNFPPDRGEWHFSHYKHKRNATELGGANGTSAGPMPIFVATETELLLAEAEAGLGNLGAAINIINAGTRTTRGQLAPLSASATAAEVDRAIMYEKSIELFNTSPFILWMERRKRGVRLDSDNLDDLGSLQTGTPAQLPVPATEMQIREETPYNFGGVNQDPDGINAFE